MRKANYTSLQSTEATTAKIVRSLHSDVVSKKSKSPAIMLWLFGLFITALSFTATSQTQVTVTSSGGTSPVNYSTLKGAFDAVNAGTHTGSISIIINQSTTETASAALNSSGGTSNYTDVTIKPATGATPTISANIGVLNSQAVIKLNGADNVTIDGSNTVNGTSRDLSIRNNSLSSGVGIWIGTSTGNPANNVTVKNCNLTQARTTGTASNSCLYYGDGSALTTASTVASKNLTITNNFIARANRGLLIFGTSSAPDSNLTINSNTVDSIQLSSMLISAQYNFNIYDNYWDYKNTSAAATTEGQGIYILNGCVNGNIYKNNFYKMTHNGTTTQLRGIWCNSTAASPNISIYNNFFGDLWCPGISSSFSLYAVRLDNANGGFKVYHNTFNLTTSLSNSSAVSACLGIIGTGSPTNMPSNSVDCRNNIFRNVQNGGGNAYCLAPIGNNGANVFSNCDNNSYYSIGANVNAYGSSQTAASTLSTIQAQTGKDVNSVMVNATFTSTTDLHLQAVAGNASLNNGGTPIGTVTTDFDGATRSTNAPDIGADEIVYTPRITGFTPATACAGTSVTVNGADFTGTTAVSLAGLNASTINVVSTSQLTAIVATGATTGSNSAISVTNASGTGTSTGTLDRRAAAAYSSKSLSSGSTGDQVTITGTNFTGATAVSFNGTAATTFSVTSATEILATVPTGATTGNIIITDFCGNSINAGSFTVNPANPCSTPTADATNFVASSTSSSALSGTFSLASGNPSGYLVVYATAALSGVPQTGSSYTAGSSAFSGTVLQSSASNSVSLTGLTPNTTYTITIFPYNGGGCTGGPLYKTDAPLTYTFTTCSGVPTSVTATPVGNTSGNSVNFTWVAPTGGGALGVTYSLEVTTDANYTSHVSGSPFSTNQLSQSVTGLAQNTQYYYRIRSTNGCFSSYVSNSVTSACGAANSLPIYQNFDATVTSALPTCWLAQDVNGDGITWTSSNIDSRVTGLSNPRALRYVANTTTTSVAANDWAFMPGVQLTGGQSYTLSFLQNALSNSAEGLQIYYGTSQSSSIAITANKIYDDANLTNTAAAYRTATFTPATNGTYYIGFKCTSPSNANGGLFLFLDEITLDVTPTPPPAPSPISTSNVTAYSVQVNWTDNSSNEIGHYVYSSLDGTNWILRNTVGPNVTSSIVDNLKQNTAYYFRVIAYNAGGSGSPATTAGTTTTLTCGSYTTNSYVGTLFTGSGNNWLNTTNWSLGHVPNACEDVQVNGTLPITTTCFLYLKTPVAIRNLTINQTTAGTALQRLFLWTQDNSFDISGNVTVAINRTANTTVTGDAVYLVSGPGVMTIDGALSLGETGNGTSALGSGGATIGPINLKGNVTFGPNSFLNFGNLINFVFDAPSAQTVTLNSSSTSANPATYGMGSVTIGSTNTPTVTFTDTMPTNGQMSRIVNDFTINNGCSVIIANGTTLNRTQSSSGTFTLGTNSNLTLSGVTGGVGNSNFPDSFANHSFASSSTVTYNGASAQTIAAAPAYGNLTLNNGSGATLSGNTTVNNVLTLSNGKITTGASKLTLGLSGTISGASSSRYINGNFAKTKPSNVSGFLNFEIGDATNYAPVFVGFNGTTNSGGVMTASTTAGTPAALGFLRSGISTTEYVNRKYTIANSGITGHTSIYNQFTYNNSDMISAGSASNTNYRIADSIYGGGWTIRTTTNDVTPYSAATVSLTSGQSADYLIGELDPPPAPTVATLTVTTACEGSNYTVAGSNFYGVTGVTIGSANCSFTVNSSTQITIVIPTGIANGAITVTNSTGSGTSSNILTTADQPLTTVTPSTQTVCSGVAISAITIGNSNNISGTTYSWTRSGNNAAISGATSGTSSTISGSFTSTSTIPETMIYTINSLGGNGCAGTTVTDTLIIKASPGSVSLSPTSSAICENAVQQLTANYTAATGNQTTNSGTINVSIPDGTGTNGVNGLGGVNTTLAMSTVPTGAVVTRIDVGFNINHTFTGDLAVNVTAPNGKTLNLAYGAGAATDNFVNTVISSASDPNTDFLPQDSIPGGITGTYAADAYNNVGPVAYKSNTTLFSDLFSTPNGTWRLSARDYGAGDVGAITNWYVKIYYTLQPTFVWSPTAGLYLTAGHTSAYTGGSQQTVYAYNTPGNYSYSANISFDGCTVSSTAATVDIDPIPVASRTPASQTVCSGTAITQISASASNDPTATFSWTRDHTSDVTGIAASGTGNISGTFTNTTSSPITVTFTITPVGSGAQACAGSSVTATVTVNPVPLATATPSTQNACSGSAITQISFGTSNNVAGTNYTWTRNNTTTATGIAASGSSFVSGTLTNASAQTTVTFTVTAVGPGTSACAGTPTTATVIVYNPPSTYSVTGGGSFCSPGSGVAVGLSSSQSGFNYQAYTNGSPNGSAVAGTNSAISFGNQTDAGTYTVVASNAGCNRTMSGSATVTPITTLTPSVNLITSSTTVCANTNVAFFAIPTNPGTSPSYVFKVNGNPVQTGSLTAYLTTTLQNNDVVSVEMTSNNTCQSTNVTSSQLTMTVSGISTLPTPAAITGTTNYCTIGGIGYVNCATTNGLYLSSNTSIATVNQYTGKVTAIANGSAVITYTISGGGCTNNSAVAVVVDQQATPAAITGLTTPCNGGANSSTTYASATPNGVWSISNNRGTINSTSGLATFTAAGSSTIIYKVTNATTGCSASRSLAVTIGSQPLPPSISYVSFGPSGKNPVASAGNFCLNRGGFTLAGSPSGGTWASTVNTVMTVNPINVSQATVNFIALGPVSLTYTAAGSNGCSSTRTFSGTIVNCASRGTNAERVEADFALYPNPARSTVSLQIETLLGEGQIVVTDLYGKQVKAQALSLGNNTIDISKLSKGVYMVSMITNEGKKTKKLIVE